MQEESSDSTELVEKTTRLTDYARSILKEAEDQTSEIERSKNLIFHTLKSVKDSLNVLGEVSDSDFSLCLYLGSSTIVFSFILFYFFF